jgi:hypothetical protein
MSKPVDPTNDIDHVVPPQPNPTPARRSSRKPAIGPIVLLILTSLIFFLYARSYNSLNKELGTWGCRMSWMAPNYIKMDGPEGDLGGLERKYGVYLYREGGLQGDAKVRMSGLILLLDTVSLRLY